MQQTSFGPVGLFMWVALAFAQGAGAQPAPPPLLQEGASNTALGWGALAVNDGDANVAVGVLALAANQGGNGNTATGAGALYQNIGGHSNTANGYSSLASNTGSANTASGSAALYYNTTGAFNTAAGFAALQSNTTGSFNVAMGQYAGFGVTAGSYNVHLGAGVTGTAADANTIRIGLPYNGGTGQNQTFIAGIHGTQLAGSYLQVVVDANGQLGTLTPPVQLAPGATATPLSVLQQQIQEQQAINAELRATNTELRTRLARIEALLMVGAGRR